MVRLEDVCNGCGEEVADIQCLERESKVGMDMDRTVVRGEWLACW